MVSSIRVINSVKTLSMSMFIVSLDSVSYTHLDVYKRQVIIKSTGNEKSRITVMLGVTADGRKLPLDIILKPLQKSRVILYVRLSYIRAKQVYESPQENLTSA